MSGHPERLAARALTAATALGVALVALGTLAASGAGIPALDTTPATLDSLRRGLPAGEPPAILLAGILALFAGPLLRLVAGAAALLRAGERRSGLLALAVVAAVVVNVALAIAGTRP